MSQSYYSYLGTRLHLLLDDDLAADFNQAQTLYYEAEANFGIDPQQGRNFSERWQARHHHAWEEINGLLNHLEKINGPLKFDLSEMTSNQLVLL